MRRGRRSQTGLGLRRLLFAQGGSFLGDGLILAAFPLIAAEISRTPAAVAHVMLFATLPQFLAALPAGVVTDRAERRSAMTAAACLAAIALAALAALLGSVRVDLVALDAVAFVVGTAQVLIAATGSALLPQVVASDNLEGANAWMFSMQHAIGTLAGSPLAGVLIAVSLAAPLWAAAGCYVLAAAVLVTSRATFHSARAETTTGLIADAIEGFRVVAGHPQLRAFTAVTATATANIATNAVVVVLVLYAVAPGPLELSKAGYGLILSCGGLGAMTGALTAKHLSAHVNRGALLAGSILAIAVGLAGPGLLVDPYSTGSAFALAGMGVGSYNVISVSFRQRVVPTNLLGRATAAYRLAGMGAVPLGALLGGLAAADLGLRPSFLVAGALSATCLAVTPLVTERALHLAETRNNTPRSPLKEETDDEPAPQDCPSGRRRVRLARGRRGLQS